LEIIFPKIKYTVTEIVNKNANEYTKFNSTVKTDNYTNTTAQKSLNVTYESTDKLDTAERYGYTFKGWYTKPDTDSTAIQITDATGKFKLVSGYTSQSSISGTSKIVWTKTSATNLYAHFQAISREVNFDCSVNYTGGITNVGATLNGTKAYILMADYGYFDLNGASKLKTTATETGLDAVFYKDTNFNTKYDKIIQTTPATYRFDGWYTQKDTSLTGPTGNLVLDADQKINKTKVTFNSNEYTNGSLYKEEV